MKRLLPILGVMLVFVACQTTDERQRNSLAVSVAQAERMSAEFDKVLTPDAVNPDGIDWTKGEIRPEIIRDYLRTNAKNWRVWAVWAGVADPAEIGKGDK